MPSGTRIRHQLGAGTQYGDVYALECPSRVLLDHVTSRWGVLVLVLLLERPHRFSELASAVDGMSDKMLSQTLKQLVTDRFAVRSVSTEPPVRVTYDVTPAGREVATRLASLVEWLESSVGAGEIG